MGITSSRIYRTTGERDCRLSIELISLPSLSKWSVSTREEELVIDIKPSILVLIGFEFPSNRTNERLWWAANFNAKRVTFTSLMRGSVWGISEVWAKVTSTKSFLQTAARMEKKFLTVTSKCTLILEEVAFTWKTWETWGLTKLLGALDMPYWYLLLLLLSQWWDLEKNWLVLNSPNVVEEDWRYVKWIYGNLLLVLIGI